MTLSVSDVTKALAVGATIAKSVQSIELASASTSAEAGKVATVAGEVAQAAQVAQGVAAAVPADLPAEVVTAAAALTNAHTFSVLHGILTSLSSVSDGAKSLLKEIESVF